MIFLLTFASPSTQCRESFQQWLKDPPEGFNWGQCLELFLDNSLKTLYPKFAEQIGAYLSVSYIDKKMLNQTYYEKDFPGKCVVRVDSRATNVLQASACTNCESPESPLMPMGRLNRIFLDLYALNAYQMQLDTDLMMNAQFKAFLPPGSCGIKSLTLRQILSDKAPVSPTLFGNFIKNDTKWIAPGAKKILKKCQPGEGGDSLMMESLKVAALMALGGFVDENSFLTQLTQQFDQYYILPKFAAQQQDFTDKKIEPLTRGGNVDARALLRYESQPTTPLPFYNGYVKLADLTKLQNVILLDGFDSQQDGTEQAAGRAHAMWWRCAKPPVRKISLEASRTVFEVQHTMLGKDALAIQKLLGFSEIDVQGTKFSTLHGSRTGFFSGMAFYQNDDFGLAFSLLLDVGEDQLFYEALAFLKSFFIEKTRSLSYHASGRALSQRKMIPAEIPAVGFTSQFLKLFSRVTVDSLVEYRPNLAANRNQRPINVNFYLEEKAIASPAGDFLYDTQSLAVSFFVLCGISLVCGVLISLIGFFKKDQNKATNLFETCIFMPRDIRAKLSKRYRSDGFWFLFRQKSVKEEEGLDQSSDGDGADYEKAQEKAAGKKFKLSVNTMNIINYYLALVRLLMLVFLVIFSIVSLYITGKQTNVIQIAFVNEKLWTSLIYAFSWVWFFLGLVQLADNIYVLGFNVCSVTWTWIVLQLLAVCVDFALVIFMGQANLLTNVGGGSQTW